VPYSLWTGLAEAPCSYFRTELFRALGNEEPVGLAFGKGFGTFRQRRMLSTSMPSPCQRV